MYLLALEILKVQIRVLLIFIVPINYEDPKGTNRGTVYPCYTMLALEALKNLDRCPVDPYCTC